MSTTLQFMIFAAFLLQGCDNEGGSAIGSDITFPIKPAPTNSNQSINKDTDLDSIIRKNRA